MSLFSTIADKLKDSLKDENLNKGVDPALKEQLIKRGQTDKLAELEREMLNTQGLKDFRPVSNKVKVQEKQQQKSLDKVFSPVTKTVAKIFPIIPAINDSLEQGSLTPFKAYTEKYWEKINQPLDTETEDGRERLANITLTLSGEPLKDVGKPIAKTAATKAKSIFSSFVEDTKAVGNEFNAQSYVKEMAQKQKDAGISPVGTALGKVKNFFSEIKTKLVDSNAPIEDVLREAQKKGRYEVLPQFDITNQIDRTLRAPTLAGQFARDNGIERVIKEVDDLDNLEQYLIAKQAQRVEQKGITTGRNLENDKKLIEVFKDQYEPYAQQVTQYSQKLLDYSTDSGLINKELADKLKIEYPDYVPLNRVFNEMEKSGGEYNPKSVASLSKQSVVQKLEGSEREIESPVASLLAKTNDAFVQGEKNKTARILANFKDLPDNPFQLRELPVGETAPHTISFLDNGKKRTFETTKEISEAAKALNVQQLNILGQIFAFPVRVAKAGITGLNPAFILSNIVRDQQLGAILAKDTTSIANPVNFFRSLMSAVKHDDLYEEVVRSGAGGTSFDIARNQAKKTVDKIRSGRSVVAKIKYIVKNPSELLRAVEDVVGRSEELTRIQQYRGTKESLLKKGYSEIKANVEAAKAARENTANFYRKGEWGKVLNSAFLYLNASVQGSRAFIRSFARDPKGTGVKIAISLFLPTATVTAWNLSDPKRKEVYDSIPAYEKENNLILLPPNPTKDEKGQWNIIKIPLPPGVSSLAIPVRTGLEQAFGINKFEFNDVAEGLYKSVDPLNIDFERPASVLSTLTPQLIKPTAESTANFNFFTGQPIVPKSMEKLSPELQVKPYTSGSARLIGNALNRSPIKVEEFIKSTGGGLAINALNLSDRILAGLDIIPKNQIGGKSISESIAARFTKASGAGENKTVEELSGILQKQADDSFRLKQEAELIYDELRELPKDQANEMAKAIKIKNPALFEKLKTVTQDAKLGLTYEDRLLKQLNVKTGERAKFIFEKTKQLETKGEKNAYIKELKEKKIISDEVFDQIKNLIKTNNK